jgi:hypothetical protein
MPLSANKKGFANLIVIAILAVAALFVTGLRKCRRADQKYPERNVTVGEGDWRHHKVIFTSHARCRMECRDITEDEVEYILANGVINEAKSKEESEEAEGHCPTYALEGNTKDGQHVRIVVGACEKITKVITAIDLDKEHECNCR